MPRSAGFLLMVLAIAACSTTPDPEIDIGRYSMTSATDNIRTLDAGTPAPLDPTRPISDRDCSRAMDIGGGNLRCR
jgi:hypothetical protein